MLFRGGRRAELGPEAGPDVALLDVWGGVLEVAMGDGVDSGEKSVRSEEMDSIASMVCAQCRLDLS